MDGESSRTASLVVLIVATVLALALGACGSSDSDSTGGGAAAETSGGAASAGLQAVEQEVEELRGEITEFTPPGPPIDAKSVRGGSVWYIPVSAQIPVLAVEAQGMKEAAAAAGMRFNSCDGKFVPATQSACIARAVNADAAGIITDSIDPKTVAPALRAAAAARVPVMGFNSVGEESDLYRTLNSGDPESQVAAMKWIIVDSGGTANVLGTTFVGDGQTEAGAAAGVKALKDDCSECEYDAVTVTAQQINSIASAVSSALLKGPDVDYGFPQFDFFAPNFERGVQQAGRTNDMKTVSTNAALSQIQAVASGGMQVADVGANRNYIGWQAMDGLLRMSLGEPAPENVTYPIRVFDETNVDELELSKEAAAGGEWWGPTTYKQEFPKLWGVGSA